MVILAGYMFRNDVVAALEEYSSKLVDSVMSKAQAVCMKSNINVHLFFLIILKLLLIIKLLFDLIINDCNNPNNNNNCNLTYVFIIYSYDVRLSWKRKLVVEMPKMLYVEQLRN